MPSPTCLRRQSGGRLHPARRARRLDAARRPRDEPVGNGVLAPRQERDNGFELRWFTPTMRSGLVRACDAGQRARVVGDGTTRRRRHRRFHTRSGLLTATRQGEWIEPRFPATPDQPLEAPGGARRSGRRAAAIRRPEPVRLSVELSDESAVRGCVPIRPAPRVGRTRRDGHEPGRRTGCRFRLAVLRARVRHRRRPGNRIDALLPRTVLEPPAEQADLHRASGVGARRHPEGDGGRRARPPRRAGGDGASRRVAGSLRVNAPRWTISIASLVRFGLVVNSGIRAFVLCPAGASTPRDGALIPDGPRH